MSNLGLWLKGLLAAMAGGAIASAAQTLTTTGNVRTAQLKTAAITGAALTLAAYLTQSPVAGKN